LGCFGENRWCWTAELAGILEQLADGPASPDGNQECSLSNSFAEIFLVGWRMDQATQVNIPQEQFLEARFKKAFDEVSYSFEKILGEVRGYAEQYSAGTRD
jgi:hypothetical protein